jgi:peptide/nickel transport system substrate-binding protein
MRRTLLSLILLLGFSLPTFAQNQRLVIAQGQDIVWLNPMKTTAQVNLNAATQIVEGLMMLDVDQQTIKPLLATSWERLDDLTFQVKLREGVTFTNGEPFNAEVAKFSLELGSREAAMSNMLSAIERVDVVDDYTINIVTSNPYPLMEISLARSSYMLPPAYFQEVGEDAFNEAPIGTGPYMLTERVSGQRVVMRANPDYWGGAPAIPEIEFRPIQEDGARIAALQTGEVHLATNMPLAFIPRLEQAAGVSPVTVEGARIYLVILDNRPDVGSPLEDKRVRQALNYAVDKEALIDALFEGRARLVDGQQANANFVGYNPNLEPYPYDPERARELLAEAGYPDGLELTFKYPFGRIAGDKEVSEAIAGMLEEVGVRTEQIVLESGEFLNQLVTLQLTPMALAAYATAPDAHYQYSINLTGERYSYYHNPEYDELVKRAATTTDPAERQALYEQAAEIAHDDPPFIFLFTPDDLYGVSDRLQGWQPRPDQGIDLRGVTFQ